MENAELETILLDGSKTIAGDIKWSEDEDHSPATEFRAEVDSADGWPLFVRGSYNPLARALTFALILKPVGRIYALDIGKDHHNPTCQQIGEKHKHRWSEQFSDKQAYVPEDITAGVDDPVRLWEQFCTEAKIVHNGKLETPRTVQKEPFL
ncbi:MAG: DUF6978 family protein [Phycisphaerae bacterium]